MVGAMFQFLRDDGRLCLNVPLDKNKGGQQSVGGFHDNRKEDRIQISFHHHLE
jgi:hypothetical protein